MKISISYMRLKNHFHSNSFATLVPEVFLDFSLRKRSRASHEAATTSRESDEEREKKRFFSLSCTLSRLVVAASRLALDLFREEKSRKTSGTRV